MAVYSMTGFGKGESVGESYTITTEIKTVNNRFKDYKFRMSNIFNSKELELRALLDEHFKRGSFDISIVYKKTDNSQIEFQVDTAKVKAYIDLLGPVLKETGFALKIAPTDFLRSDFYLAEDDSQKEAELLSLLEGSVNEAIVALKASRQKEGEKLVAKLQEHLNIYENHLTKVEELKNLYPEILREKLQQKFEEKLKDIKIDESRFMQEIIYYLEKLDVDEEITRAKIHIAKLRSILNSNGEIGRQIDFLLQELGRETNTLGSKSAQSEISSHVVEMKVQLEKIREQALNLE
ncbi:MAG TPA: YicC/YloC family endoribonuclease [Bacteriovoracaceae bacterium]|nr:YicC/YloC family endoribonuclease [Bacteriovoracaceae bacterium]